MQLVPFLIFLFFCLTFAALLSLLQSSPCDSLASKSDTLQLCAFEMRD